MVGIPPRLKPCGIPSSKIMIILFGSKGYIGSEFARQLEAAKIPTFFWPDSHKTTFADLERWYDESGYPLIGAVINAAGYTGKPNVDTCELNKEATVHGNVVFPQILTDWCILNDVPIGHVSSGCIYQGTKPDGSGFTEEDEPNFSWNQNNCSFYSGTKALGEKVVNRWEKHYIWRLRIPFDENNGPRNYISKMMKYTKLLQAENSISHKTDFVRACIETINKKVPYGIYNITNTGTITTKQLVTKLQNTIAKDRKFELITEDDLYTKFALAKTPRSNCVLDNSKLLNVGIKMRTVDEALDNCLTNWKK